jgi:3-oxoacyl-[acyl-carrier-protein] synthase II
VASTYPTGCDLDYILSAARRPKCDVALSNGFGFGGQNITLVARRFSD